MARILTRPMFRKGGLSRETGIMSGLDSPRRGYAQGSYAPRVRYQTGFPGVIGGYKVPYNQIPQVASNWKTKGMNLMKSPNLSERGLWELGKRYAPKAWNLVKGVGTRFPVITTVLGGEYVTRPEDWEKEMDISRLDKIKRDLIPGWGMKKKLEQYEAWKNKEKVPKKQTNLTENNDLDTKVTGDMESDLMRAYKEYAPIFEKELGVSPDDTKKQLWMQLAKFGTGLMAQPGGDLVGAVGKAAEKPLEGAGAVVKDVSTAKRQAKLLALQTAIREGEPGQIGKAIKDIAKIYNVSKKEAAAIYEKWNRNDTTARAAANARYADQAKNKLGLVGDDQNRYIAEANKIAEEYPELVGQFNNKLPEEKKEWEIGYYVSDTGKFVRVVEKDGKKVAIGMDEPGFSDKKKTKK